jgi:hypothetical protein
MRTGSAGEPIRPMSQRRATQTIRRTTQRQLTAKQSRRVNRSCRPRSFAHSNTTKLPESC